MKIRHIRNLPPNDFIVSDKHVLAEHHRELLSSNDSYHIDNFTSIFEDLWKKGVDAADRIRGIE